MTCRKPIDSLRRCQPLILLLALLLAPKPSPAFCGFYVAKAGAELFNQASQVVLVRDGTHTVLTMANDFQGDPETFAVVIPVPELLQRGQIHIANPALIDHLDAYTAPRLVEYFDENPCQRYRRLEKAMVMMDDSPLAEARAKSLGVRIEARYTVGEYDILLLSAKQSNGLVTWLKENGYRIPDGAEPVVNSYIKQGMHFFVAKVNLKQHDRLGFQKLRPIQVAFDSRKFMLPIRLGMVNAKGPQELFVYTLTRKGRVETANYRTVKLPTGVEVPAYIKDEFSDFYRALFREQTRREHDRAVFLEYAWNMNSCDPCAADPLSREELAELGVYWLDDTGPAPVKPMPRRIVPPGPASAVYVTRLHLRYDKTHFPDDLMFLQTKDRSNFQSRYIIRHPWQGNEQCAQAERYRKSLRQRREKEAQTLANLTGWNIDDIHHKAGLDQASAEEPAAQPWWKSLWRKQGGS